MHVLEHSRELPVELVYPSPFHIRKESAAERLEDLAESIRHHGLIHAVSVVRDPSGRFELINGHRRWMAHKKADLGTIRANVYLYDEDELKDESLRRQRVREFLFAANSAEPLIPIERARAYRDFMETFGWDGATIARAMHVTEDSVIDDMQLLNLTPEVLDLVAAHHDSFTVETLRVLGRYASAGASKAWVMNPEEQLKVATELALQRDKRLMESSRVLESHIKQIVKTRRDAAKTEKRKVGRGTEDPVKALFRMLDSVRKVVSELSETDLAGIKEIDAIDKGKLSEDLYGMAQRLIDFAEGPVAKLKTKRGSRAA